MNKDAWDRIAQVAQGRESMDSADVALALLDLRTLLETLNGELRRCQDSLHHVDKHLGKVASDCKIPYGRVTSELLGE